MTGYEKFAGRCKELSELVKKDSNLRLVSGWYHCPIWGARQHWWCENKETKKIIDPTKSQFPSNGIGPYEEFMDIYHCEQCGKELHLDDVIPMGNFPVCSASCARRLVGV